MKSILMSFQPQRAMKIANKEKLFEIRKRFPLNYVGWVYMYCTKGQLKLRTQYYNGVKTIDLVPTYESDNTKLNGKVIARFWCDKVTKLEPENSSLIKDYWADHDIVKDACLTRKELWDYGQGKPLYAIHITKLEIFDTPKELGEFHAAYKYATLETIKDYERETGDITSYRVKKAPQSWQWIEVEE